MSFHVIVFSFCISREYDVSEKIMSMFARHEMPHNVLQGDMTLCQLLPTQVYICELAIVVTLLLTYITSLSKISLCPRFLKPSLKPRPEA